MRVCKRDRHRVSWESLEVKERAICRSYGKKRQSVVVNCNLSRQAACGAGNDLVTFWYQWEGNLPLFVLYLTDRDARVTMVTFSKISLPCCFVGGPENSWCVVLSLQSSVNKTCKATECQSKHWYIYIKFQDFFPRKMPWQILSNLTHLYDTNPST